MSADPADATDAPSTGTPAEPIADVPVLVVANEFADVQVRLVRSRNGTRLELLSPRRGTRVHLDAVELDCLTQQRTEFFSEMIDRTTTR